MTEPTADPTDPVEGPALHLVLPDAETTRAFGAALAGLLRAGDLVVLTGDLGAGKTTLTQGIGAGLGVRGQVASPTFIVAREHPSLTDGPALVHVDAYRLGSLDEVDALDLDSSLDESVTVVEWGSGLVESLAGDRLEIVLERPRGGVGTDDAPEAGARRVVLRAVGPRWSDLDVAALARAAGVGAGTGSPEPSGRGDAATPPAQP
ncbi:tRNA (adenosine(37)-N6)-threonylcarbamoyltransferase complex ATPase subunit type 1 TsaE [Cellulosimicrobium sp. Marseille-Q4280]|uniref:tRNA (adenosine(37)-N6)-threonylcarbamoyltransferase complex ATPase subunit type 1 TsaE n=1 Tax=Cellulosimicrobium sp. Marseille-Q4280 TaxID=2937992 RepID=UPI00203A4CF7|nr:tRNA (adenosine(37)-N6)-threonylcarbamoyltransferase complex ATPase subunit type 1 TsaE [Cellulosimicrobium sp. Marseille-Q4280]